MIAVKVYWNTYPDGSAVPNDVSLEDGPISYYGPFDSISDAVDWMNNDYPDGDTDVAEMVADDFRLPRGTFVNDPASIHGDIPDEDIRDITDEQIHDMGPTT